MWKKEKKDVYFILASLTALDQETCLRDGVEGMVCIHKDVTDLPIAMRKRLKNSWLAKRY